MRRALVWAVLAILLPLMALFGVVLLRPPVVPEPWPSSEQADRIIVLKQQRELQLWRKGKIIRRYPIVLGWAPEGHKLRQGDGRTPEGEYQIIGRNPQSRYHLSLRLSYPSAEDQRQAEARGESPGGDIMIHGLMNGLGWLGPWHRLFGDWTAGCVALTNEEMTEIWAAVPDGVPVLLRP